MDDHLASLRAEYTAAGLTEGDLAADPVTMFRRWFTDAAHLDEPNAMVLSTVAPDGSPSSRIVLLKGLQDDSFVFFTNGSSRKGVELAANPHCALLFPWHGLQRQVRVEGEATPLSRAAVAAYFATRPRGAQLGAHASPQSAVVTPEELQQRYAAAEAAFPDEVPPPDGWGGYAVRPEVVEFWQGRANRMHDRLRYRRDDGDWVIERLAP